VSERIRQFLGATSTLRRVALASIVVNVGIVLTGGAVRLTGSGLGCPTWPRCTDESYVTTGEMGAHGAIEFGNRMLTFVVGAVAVLGVLSALAQRCRPPRTLALAVLTFVGIPAQGVVGGITVLTNLNPWVVGGHFLVSIGVLASAYAFWRAAGGGPRYPQRAPEPLRWLAWITATATATVLVLGTFVTGSGPHAGDADARRNGLDPQAVSQLHADMVFLLIGLALGLWLAARAAKAPTTAAGVLVLLVLGQGLIGFVQYATDLPVVLVSVHMGGACAVWLASLAALASMRRSADAIAEPRPPDLPASLTRATRQPRQPRGLENPGADANALLGLGGGSAPGLGS
jgi:heme a synthase